MKGRFHHGSDKWLHINQVIRDQKIGILALQETHLSKLEENSINQIFQDRLHLPNARGVAIVINKQLTNWKGVQTFELIPGRAVLAKLPWHKDACLNVLNIYAPNDSSTNAEFWELLLMKMEMNPKPDILLGDFNLVEDALDRLPPHADARRATEALAKLKMALNLVDGWRMENPDSTAFTFSQSRAQGGAQSRIDRIYLKRDALIFSKEWHIEPSGIHTDHQLVSARISDHRMPYVGKGRWSLPLFILKDQEVSEEIVSLGRILQQKINQGQHLQPRSETDNPQTAFKSFKDAVISTCRRAAKEAIPKIQRKMNTIKSNLKTVLNDKSLSEEERQHTGFELQEQLDQLQMIRHNKTRDNLAAKIRLENRKDSKDEGYDN
ncbi:Endonuclease/exonuclease/phosphatase [Melanogaster broomeanus]|nr:Endonuclease/exonuclease/phosphatase [Melanogaster broomeanus]